LCAFKALSVVSRLLQLTRGIPGCLNPAGFQATLKFSMSHPHGSCGKAQEAPVLLTQSRTTLLACLEELHHQIEQRHGSECVKAVQACKSAHKTSRAAELFLACSYYAQVKYESFWAWIQETDRQSEALRQCLSL